MATTEKERKIYTRTRNRRNYIMEVLLRRKKKVRERERESRPRPSCPSVAGIGAAGSVGTAAIHPLDWIEFHCLCSVGSPTETPRNHSPASFHPPPLQWLVHTHACKREHIFTSSVRCQRKCSFTLTLFLSLGSQLFGLVRAGRYESASRKAGQKSSFMSPPILPAHTIHSHRKDERRQRITTRKQNKTKTKEKRIDLERERERENGGKKKEPIYKNGLESEEREREIQECEMFCCFVSCCEPPFKFPVACCSGSIYSSTSPFPLHLLVPLSPILTQLPRVKNKLVDDDAHDFH